MAIPVSYNVRSLAVRWSSTIVAIVGIAGTVGVFVAVLALAHGFKATLVKSGSPRNAIILRAGSTSEMMSGMGLDQVKVIQDAPGVERLNSEPAISPEVVVVAAFPLKSSGTDANVQVRGVSPTVLNVRDNIRITAGRMFRPGLNELVVGRNVADAYRGLELGQDVQFGGGTWKVVGTFDAGGSAFDSEVWCENSRLSEVYKRPQNVFQSLTVRLTSAAAFTAFKDSLTSDPRLQITAERESDYYERQSQVVSTLIYVLGSMVAIIMALGAILGALNTMYSAVAERSREVATMRAVGFGAGSVIFSFTIESLCIAFVGAVVGCLAVLPINGLTTGTMNWQTFSHVAFAFQVTPWLIFWGIVFGLFMGLIGGVPPAIRASRATIAVALREL